MNKHLNPRTDPNGLGRRISRTAGETTTWYFYDGFNCIAEYTGTTLTTRTWGLDLSGTLQGAGGVGGLLAVNIGGTSYYPAFDGNGNVSEYLTTSGVVAAHFEYDPFGNLTYLSEQTAGLAALFDYRFSTKPLDQDTGLYYYTYRWYDPLTGRWPSRDPIEEWGGINLHGFVGNDGVNRWDFLGLDECEKGDNKFELLDTAVGPATADGRPWSDYMGLADGMLTDIQNMGRAQALGNAVAGAVAGLGRSVGSAVAGAVPDLTAGALAEVNPDLNSVVEDYLGRIGAGKAENTALGAMITVRFKCRPCVCKGWWYWKRWVWDEVDSVSSSFFINDDDQPVAVDFADAHRGFFNLPLSRIGAGEIAMAVERARSKCEK
jgi:RHS repeat-associated protein